MLVRRKTNQRPRPLSLKCRKFLKHGLSPKRGFGSLCVIGGFNTAIICTGEESSRVFGGEEGFVFANAKLGPDDHRIAIS